MKKNMKNNMSTKDICPNCEKVTDVELVKSLESIKVRGEEIKVDVEYYKCLKCGGEFTPPHSGSEPVDKAYREYRKRTGMLQPEEIKAFRDQYGLRQGELSKLLGWGVVTLSRYENGALQDDAHENAFRLVMEPSNLLKLIKKNPGAIASEEKRNQLIEDLKANESEASDFNKIFEERFGQYGIDDLCGYKPLDLAKVYNSILFFCKGRVVKTKLNKLLFYADFKHFKDNAISITGLRYVHLQFGPVPENFQHYFATLIHEDKSINVEEKCYPNGYCGEDYISVKEPDLSIFTPSELKILAAIKVHFLNFNASEISKLSHEEKAYKNTPLGGLISYGHADDLSL